MYIVRSRFISLVGLLFTICVAFTVANRVYSQEALDDKSVDSGDWPMWGGSGNRNQANSSTGVSFDFELPTKNQPGKKILWTARLGSQTYGSLAVSGGKVFVGANNGGKYRPNLKGDKGVLLCFDEETGKFLWQLTRDKLATGRVNDWPLQGIVSNACVEKNRLWVVTNRAELMCIDTEGFYDDENDGPCKDEVDAARQDADIVWTLDMIDELGVFPHNLAISSPVVYGDLVFVLTSNGVDEAHLNVPMPRAPSFLAVNKHTGKVVWEDNSPWDRILHGQWSSPSIGVVDGEAQVYMAGGDGWLYAFAAEKGELIWKFDLNPKDSKWELGGRGTRNSVAGTPVFYENSVVVATGQDPEHGEGVAHLYRIDATKTGDVSAELGEIGKPGTPNPNTAMIWRYGGIDADGSITGEAGESIFRRTLSTAAVGDGAVFIPDGSGYLHCVDWQTGKRHWQYDLLMGIWGSAMLVDGKVMLGTEDGELLVFEASKERANIIKKWDTMNYSAIYGTPVIANGKLFVVDRTRIYVMSIQ